MEIRIEGEFDATDLQTALEETVPPTDMEFSPVRGRSQTRFITGLEPMALLAVLKGAASLAPLIVALLKYFGKKRKSGEKVKTLKIIAIDDSILSVPENTSRESLSTLLEHQPKFKNPKLITIE